jgi:hypothetical protein
MFSVNNFLPQRQVVNIFRSTLTTQKEQRSPEVERPLSEYDNLQLIASPKNTSHHNYTTVDDIQNNNFVDFQQEATAMTSSAQSNYTNLKPQYENVMDPAKREQQGDLHENGTISAMSEAKSSFFGLNQSTKNASERRNDDSAILIDDSINIKILPNEVRYVNVTNDNDLGVSATSSASGSSVVTATPSASPTRETRDGSRKNSFKSTRSKSPKFIIPSPSHVSKKMNIIIGGFILNL